MQENNWCNGIFIVKRRKTSEKQRTIFITRAMTKPDKSFIHCDDCDHYQLKQKLYYQSEKTQENQKLQVD